MIEYTLIRSRRRTLAIEITRDARLLVRAPLRASQRQIDAFLAEKSDWIATHLARQRERMAAHPEPDEATWAKWSAEARAYLPGRVAHFAAAMGVVPTAVRYSRARTRFGSCSAKDSITFSLRLMDYPKEAVDYVVVHELAHIRYKNHGREFYRFVASVLPDYKRRERMLKR